MPRPKSGKANEVLTVRVPPGLVEEIHDRARLRDMLFRDYILNALEAYHDSTKFDPLDRDARQAITKVVQQLTSLTRTLREVGRPGNRAEPTGSVSRVPAEFSADPPAPVPARNGATFDTTKFYLGKLCPGGHDWNGTGQTLKENRGNKCRLCENAGKIARREAKRQALAASAD